MLLGLQNPLERVTPDSSASENATKLFPGYRVPLLLDLPVDTPITTLVAGSWFVTTSCPRKRPEIP